jgi:hypothetical protein
MEVIVFLVVVFVSIKFGKVVAFLFEVGVLECKDLFE